MTLGLVLLFVVAALVYFGLAQRVLDRMRLSDTQALLFLGLMVAGSFIELPITRGDVAISVNVGGALVPLALAIYLLTRADTTWERVRALLAAAATAAAISLVSRVTTFEPPQADVIDPLWLNSIIAGVVGYLAGRSRRAAFIAGTLGVILTDVIHVVQTRAMGMRASAAIGGAGVLDAVVMAGLIAVLLAEVFGETRERLQGGPETGPERPQALYQDDGGTGGPGLGEGERRRRDEEEEES